MRLRLQRLTPNFLKPTDFFIHFGLQTLNSKRPAINKGYKSL